MVSAPCAKFARSTWLPWLGGAALGGVLGAATMALVDPVDGRRRRAALGSAGRTFWSSLFASRAAGAAGPGAAHALARQAPAQADAADAAGSSDETRLLARVRRRLERLCADDHAIEVRLEGGVLELHGEVRRLEQRRVVQGLRRVYGVDEVRNFLRAYDRYACADDGRVVH